MNIVAMLGAVKGEPEIIELEGERATTFSLEIEGSSSGDTFRLISFGRPARYIKHGDRILIEGRVSTTPGHDVVAVKVDRIGRAE